MSGNAESGLALETLVRENEVRILIKQGIHKKGELVFDSHAICWVPAEVRDDIPSTPQETWLIVWEQFAKIMQSPALGNQVQRTHAMHIPAYRAGARTVSESDYRCIPMPKSRRRLRLHRAFSPIESALIRKGFVGEKWFGFFDPKSSVLQIHRSITGFCVFTLEFQETRGGCEISKAWVNMNSEQYSSAGTEHDIAVALWVLDNFSLGKEREYPSR